MSDDALQEGYQMTTELQYDGDDAHDDSADELVLPPVPVMPQPLFEGFAIGGDVDSPAIADGHDTDEDTDPGDGRE